MRPRGRSRPARGALVRRGLLAGVGRGRRRLAAAMVAVLATGVLQPLPVQAAEAAGRPRPTVHKIKPVKGRPLPVKERKVASLGAPLRPSSWPKPGAADTDVPPASGKPVRAGQLPVWVNAPAGKAMTRGGKATSPVQGLPTAGRVRVQVLDRAATGRLGAGGVVFAVAGADTAGTSTAKAASAAVGVQLDYSGFAGQFGGGYGSRLRLVQYPACAVTAPQRPECRTAKPVPAVNDTQNLRLIADVAVPPASAAPGAAGSVGGAPVVLAAVPGDTGDTGDYAATPLSPSATWNTNVQTGDFTWSYPLRMPPVPGGLVPQLSLDYSSGSVDGRTSNSNSQSSWVGDGFELWPGYIQRAYRSCEDEDAGKDQGVYPGDHCWGDDNAVLTWGGRGGELIRDGAGKWHLKDDDGTRIEKISGDDTNTGNGDGGDDATDNEYWVVTATSGTRYFFGKHTWTAGKPVTNSTWTAPVFGDDSGDPCYKSSGFKDSWCQQAWRWNLDYVVDPNGNAIVYYYDKETNRYGRNFKPEDDTEYTRSGTLKRIEYGLRTSNLWPAKAPAKVDFTTGERCIPDANFNCDKTQIGAKSGYWRDTPWDLNCNAGQDCKDQHGTIAPTYWTRTRLSNITTSVVKPDGSGWRRVDQWALTHDFRKPDTDASFLLFKLQQTGGDPATGTKALPPIDLNYDDAPNRVDSADDNLGPFTKYRLGSIMDEYGSHTTVNYRSECVRSQLPENPTENDLYSNTRLCFPVKYDNGAEIRPDWFHKYVVDYVIATDRTGEAPDMVTKYDYLGGGGWHWDDTSLSHNKIKTWSQWRGFGHVRVRTGGPTTDPVDLKTQTEHHFLRGMHGDRAPGGGTRTVPFDDPDAGPLSGINQDVDPLNGFAFKTVTFDKDGGTAVGKRVSTPWVHQTATRSRGGRTITANLVDVLTTGTWTNMRDGTWRKTRITNTYDPVWAGRKNRVHDEGDLADPDDNQCTDTAYAESSASWILDRPAQVVTVGASCRDVDDNKVDFTKQLIAATRTYYRKDDGTDAEHPLSGDPGKGNVSRTARVNTSTTATEIKYDIATRLRDYDVYGRPKTSVVVDRTDAANPVELVTATAYTERPAGAGTGLTDHIEVTSPRADAYTGNTAATSKLTKTNLDTAYGKPLLVVEQATATANTFTEMAYDPLGRLLKVWKPDRDPSRGHAPSLEYSYHLGSNGIVAVGTRTLTANGGQTPWSYALYDGFLRPRQNQAPGQGGHKVVTDTRYNDLGKPRRVNNPYYESGAPSPQLWGVADNPAVGSNTYYEYDGQGRETLRALVEGSGAGPEHSRTTTNYGPDWVNVDPPTGGTPTTTFTDAIGRTTRIRQYNSAAPADPPTDGDYIQTSFTYDKTRQLAAMTGPGGKVWSYDYDLRGRKTAQTDPDAGTVSFGYDDLDRPTSTTDARGQKVITSYDGLGRKTKTVDGAGAKLGEWKYDTLIKGQLTSTTRYAKALDGTTQAYTTAINAYDLLNRPTRTTITVPAAEKGLGGDYQFNTAYNIDGTIQSTGMPATGGLPAEVLAYGYNDLKQPTTVASNLLNQLSGYVTQTTYFPTGETESFTLTTGSKKTDVFYGYEKVTRRLSHAYLARTNQPGLPDRDAAYTYDKSGNITQISDITPSSADPAVAAYDNQCFRYDHQRRLTDAWTQAGNSDCASDPAAAAIGGPAPYRKKYTYKPDGSRTKEQTWTAGTDGGQWRWDRGYSYPGDPDVDTTKYKGHQLAGYYEHLDGSGGQDQTNYTYNYDKSGNTTTLTGGATTQTLGWNAEGHLSTVKEQTSGQADKNTSYVYGIDGNRLISHDSDGGATLHLPGTEIHANKGGTTVTGARYYTHNGQTIAMRTSAGVHFLAGDHQGTHTLAINAGDHKLARRWHNPFGETRGTPTGSWPTGETNRTFLGGAINLTAGKTSTNGPALVHLGAREYQPSTGRFISVDPLLNMENPQSWTGYTYAQNNPTTTSDPSGLDGPIRGNKDCIYANKDCDKPKPNGGWDGDEPKYPEGFGERPEGQARKDIYRRQLEQLMEQAPLNIENLKMRLQAQIAFCAEFPNEKLCGGGKVDIHEALDTLGLAGVDAADVVNALYYAGEGKFQKAFWSGLSAIPLLGSLAWAKRGKRLAGCTPNSFVPGTKVLMADGTHKPIEDVRAGDEVTSTNPKTGATTVQTVLAKITSVGPKNLIKITVDTDGKQGNRTGVMIATGDHPFWAAGRLKRWVKAKELRPGITLRTPAGTNVRVTAINYDDRLFQQVHNLTVASTHAYYVGAETFAVLAHNDKCPIDGRPHGRMGETATDDVLRSLGFTNITSEVQFLNSQGKAFRADRVALDADGNWVAFDAKTGQGSVISPNQEVGYPELARSGVILNTDRLERYGLRKGQVVTMRVEFDMWSCPTCRP